VTLQWSASGTLPIIFSLDNGLGSQTGSSVSVFPIVNTTYTLTAANSAGQATAQVTVNVTPAAVTPPASGGGGGGSSGSGGSSGGSGSGGSSGGGGSSPVTVYIPPAASSSSQPATGLTISTGGQGQTLRLINSSGTFYLIINGQRQGITDPGILYGYGFSFSDAVNPTAQDLALPLGPNLLPDNGALVKTAIDPTVYLISQNQRHGFTSASVFLGLGFKWSSVLVVTSPELDQQPIGNIISSPSSPHLPGLDINRTGTIYWIGQDSQLHGYPSLSVYNSWHILNDFSNVVPANAADMNMPVGSLVSARVMQ